MSPYIRDAAARAALPISVDYGLFGQWGLGWCVDGAGVGLYHRTRDEAVLDYFDLVASLSNPDTTPSPVSGCEGRSLNSVTPEGVAG